MLAHSPETALQAPGILRRTAELYKLDADITLVWAETGAAAAQEGLLSIPNEAITINQSGREGACSPRLLRPGVPCPSHQLTLEFHLPFLPSSPIKEFITFCSAFLPKCESEVRSTV